MDLSRTCAAISTSTLVLCAATQLSVPAEGRWGRDDAAAQQKLLAAVRIGQITEAKRKLADETARGEVKLVANTVERIIRARVRSNRGSSGEPILPAAPDDRAALELHLDSILIKESQESTAPPSLQSRETTNPYVLNGLISSDNKNRVTITLQPSLSVTDLNGMREAPTESMNGAPGAIRIAHNSYDVICIWGCAVDGKPLKAHDGRTLVISLRLKR